MTLLTLAEEYRAAERGASAIEGQGGRGVGVPGVRRAFFVCLYAGAGVASAGDAIARGKARFKE